MEELTLNEATEEILNGTGAEETAEELPGEALFEEEALNDGAPENETTEEGEGEAYSEEELAGWEEFAEAYPEITAENIPEDVLRLVAQGETPKEAMRRVEIAGLKAENRALKERLAAAETAQKNRLRTPGSMLGRAVMPEDAFLAGLEG